jgi:hypothetical protein
LNRDLLNRDLLSSQMRTRRILAVEQPTGSFCRVRLEEQNLFFIQARLLVPVHNPLSIWPFQRSLQRTDVCLPTLPETYLVLSILLDSKLVQAPLPKLMAQRQQRNPEMTSPGTNDLLAVESDLPR